MLILAVVILTAQVAAQKSSSAAAALEAAKQKAIVTGDLNASIKQYRALADRYAKTDRSVAAMALVLMAQAYEAQGSVEARRVYARVLKEYPSEKEAVTLARTRLNESEPSKGPTSRTLWTSGAFPGWGRLSADGRFFSYSEYRGAASPVPNLGRDLFIHEIASGVSRNLTNHPRDSRDSASESVISPDGKRVAYFWTKTVPPFEARIGMVNLEGDPNPRALYFNPDVRDMYLQDWSPDGKWLAVELLRADTWQLGLMSVADGSVRVLKSLPPLDGRAAQGMLFSRDGKYLGYDLRQSANDRHVHILAIDGSGETTAVRQPGDNQMVGWSPDGRWLLYRSDRTGTVDLWAVGVANGQAQGGPQRLRPNVGRNFHAFGWTPNGALYYWTATESPLFSGVLVASIDPGNGKFAATPVPLTRGYQESTSQPLWSPDGSRLAYLSGLRDRTSGRPDELIVRANAGSTRVIPLKSLNVLSLDAWAPDGRSVLLGVMGGGDVPAGVYRADVDTAEVSRIAATTSPLLTDLTWMPDGRSLLVALPAPGGGGIHQIDAQTGAVTMLVSAGDGINALSLSDPRPSPEGGALYYRRAVPPNSGDATFVARDFATGNERELIRARGLQSLHLSPDGQYIAAASIDAASNSRVVLLIPTTGGQPRELARVPSGVKPDDLARMNLGQVLSVLAWNPDSRSLLVRKYIRDAQQDELFVLALDGQQSGKTVIPRSIPTSVALSPDNRQMAYTVRETALPAVREVSVLENFLPKPTARK